MTIAILSLIAVLLLALALVSNWKRRQSSAHFELVPNCLLTRYPVIFISGNRSFFYFLRYWNIFPIYLAEHGYEVYNLGLPWRNRRGRYASLLRFLEEKSQQGERFHFMLDDKSAAEFKELLAREFVCIQSVSSLPYIPADIQLPWYHRASLFLHRIFCFPHSLAPMAQLGLDSQEALKSAPLLLARVQALAEADLQGS